MTSPPPKRKPWLRWDRLIIMPVALISLFCFLFCSATLGWMWHLVYGRFIVFEGKRVRVPLEMIAFPTADGRSFGMVRMRAPIALFPSPAGSILISLNHTPFTRKNWPLNFDRLGRLDEKPSRGFRLERVSRWEFPERKITCWEQSSADSKTLSIECLSENDPFSASLYGSRQYRDVLVQLLETVSK